MGGAFLAGNTTLAVQLNIYVDPEAVKRVFISGIPFYLCLLDITHERYSNEEELHKIDRLGSREARFFSDILQQSLDIGIFSDL